MKDIYIANKDCFDFLYSVEPNIVDLAIVDPPYNMGKADWDTFEDEEEFFHWTYEWLDGVINSLKTTGSLYVFNTPYNCAYILRYLVSVGMKYRNWITWDKRDGVGYTKSHYPRRQETILFFTMSDEYTFNPDDVRVPYESETRVKSGVIKDGKRWFPNPKGRLRGDVWHVTSERHKTKVNGKTMKLPHITPKPLDLIEALVKASSNEGDLVLDCFLGSGTTAVACKKLDRRFIGTEADTEFFAITKNRVISIRKPLVQGECVDSSKESNSNQLPLYGREISPEERQKEIDKIYKGWEDGDANGLM